MPEITIYNDTFNGGDGDKSVFDAAFDVIEVIDGKEVSRTTCEALTNPECNQFKMTAQNQGFVIVAKGVAWPLVTETVKVTGYRRTKPAKGRT